MRTKGSAFSQSRSRGASRAAWTASSSPLPEQLVEDLAGEEQLVEDLHDLDARAGREELQHQAAARLPPRVTASPAVARLVRYHHHQQGEGEEAQDDEGAPVLVSHSRNPTRSPSSTAALIPASPLAFTSARTFEVSTGVYVMGGATD